MTSTQDPDTIIRFLDAGHDDPDRQLALRVTNFLGGLDARQAIAVYSLAMSMSFRGWDEGIQRAALHAINEACLRSWENARQNPDGPPCEPCGGAGMIGNSLGDAVICEVCGGRGQ
jgi:hypothetical protein